MEASRPTSTRMDVSDDGVETPGFGDATAGLGVVGGVATEGGETGVGATDGVTLTVGATAVGGSGCGCWAGGVAAAGTHACAAQRHQTVR